MPSVFGIIMIQCHAVLWHKASGLVSGDYEVRRNESMLDNASASLFLLFRRFKFWLSTFHFLVMLISG